MSVISDLNVLKARFNNLDNPSGQDFIDLIDTLSTALQNSINTAAIQNEAVTGAKLAKGTADQIYQTNSAGTAVTLKDPEIRGFTNSWYAASPSYNDGTTVDEYTAIPSNREDINPVAGEFFVFKPTSDSAYTSAQLKVNTSGSLTTVKKADGAGALTATLAVGDFKTGVLVFLFFDGTDFILMNPAQGYPA